ncbi:MAG: tRNA pseudouridine(38-40) synthase TruA, partial [Clostridia bacterium]|nr:tRNA pseudouridine(38-40) synthase TruA [Clostridia bacterium]
RSTTDESGTELPLKERDAFRVDGFNEKKANTVAGLLVGEHDFKEFSVTGSSVNTTVRTIYSVDVVRTGNEISVTVTGNGFLYNMVRLIAGALYAVSEGKLTEKEIKGMLNGEKRPNAVATLPAKGLTLVKVEYD